MNLTQALAKAPLVIDNGSGFMKAGLSWEEKPNYHYQTIVGRPKYKAVLQTSSQSDIFVGEVIESEMRGALKLRYPMKHGIIENLADMDIIWKHIYQTLNLNPKENPVLLTQANLNPQANRLAMCEHFFHAYNVPALFVAAQGILSLFATGKTTGVVLDSGDGVTHVVPIYEGYCLQHACERIDLGGRDVTEYLRTLLRRNGHTFTSSTKCNVSMLNQRTEKKFNQAKDNYILPDNTSIDLTTEKESAPEVLFAPEKIGLECLSVPGLLTSCMNKVDLDLRKALYGDIVLAGGNTMFDNFTRRLIAELKTKMRVYAPKNRVVMCWSGGANISNLTFFKSMWVSRQEFEEEGIRAVLRKTL